jgi:hypothetical protein
MIAYSKHWVVAVTEAEDSFVMPAEIQSGDCVILQINPDKIVDSPGWMEIRGSSVSAQYWKRITAADVLSTVTLASRGSAEAGR